MMKKRLGKVPEISPELARSIYEDGKGEQQMPRIHTVVITTIPHTKQRYNTCGDWQFASDGTLMIRVSKMSDWKRSLLVARHELDEAFLCTARGITEKQVDDYDLNIPNDGRLEGSMVFNHDPHCMNRTLG